jgi:hypothetical protein
MKKTYAVRLSKLSKYFGTSEENFKPGQVHEEEYIFEYTDYKEALESYKQYCDDSAKSLALQIIFASTYTVQLLDYEGTNPQYNGDKNKRRIEHQITISNL